MNNLKILLGEKIKEYRKAKNLTQQELAEIIGVGTPNISYFETGRYAPTIETLEKIAHALDAEIFEFYMFNPQKSYNEIKNELIEIINNSEFVARRLYKVYKNLDKV